MHGLPFLLQILTFSLQLSCADSVGTALWKRVEAVVRVPRSLRGKPPFDQRRTLLVPDGFRVDLIARVPDGRFLLPLPGGDVLVSRPWDGRITLVRWPRKGKGRVRLFDFATDLRKPNDMVLVHAEDTEEDGNVTARSYVYVAESNRITRYDYAPGMKRVKTPEIVVDGLPDDGFHSLKSIALKDDVLYVSVGSASNDDPRDLHAEPVKRGAIYAYPAWIVNGRPKRDGRLFAKGVRNVEGFAFAPDTGDLWASVNQRDNVKYPFRDGTSRYGRIVNDYVEDNPPDELIRVTDDTTFGWPYCVSLPSPTMDNLTSVPDVETNPEGSMADCRHITPVDKGLPAHSTPLGLTFWDGPEVPEDFRNSAIVALHGSRNRRTISGNKVIFFPWKNGRPGRQHDLVSGWVTRGGRGERWGRPVDTAVLDDGSLLISDDHAGALYKLSLIKEDESNNLHQLRSPFSKRKPVIPFTRWKEDQPSEPQVHLQVKAKRGRLPTDWMTNYFHPLRRLRNVIYPQKSKWKQGKGSGPCPVQ